MQKDRVIPVCLLALGFLLTLAGPSTAEVYINMLWDESEETFKVMPLVLDGGITFDRGYQNASGESVATGVYLYRFRAGNHTETKKMLLLR